MPLQATRGQSATVLGAVGGQPIQFIWMTADKTNQHTVIDFLQHFLEENSGRPIEDIILVSDNASSHHSNRVQAFCHRNNL